MSIDWLIDWLIDCFIHWLIDWLSWFYRCRLLSWSRTTPSWPLTPRWSTRTAHSWWTTKPSTTFAAAIWTLNAPLTPIWTGWLVRSSPPSRRRCALTAPSTSILRNSKLTWFVSLTFFFQLFWPFWWSKKTSSLCALHNDCLFSSGAVSPHPFPAGDLCAHHLGRESLPRAADCEFVSSLLKSNTKLNTKLNIGLNSTFDGRKFQFKLVEAIWYCMFKWIDLCWIEYISLNLFGRLIDWLIFWSIDWLIGWLVVFFRWEWPPFVCLLWSSGVGDHQFVLWAGQPDGQVRSAPRKVHGLLHVVSRWCRPQRRQRRDRRYQDQAQHPVCRLVPHRIQGKNHTRNAINWPIHGRLDWLINHLIIDSGIDRLIDWLVGWLIDWLIWYRTPLADIFLIGKIILNVFIPAEVYSWHWFDFFLPLGWNQLSTADRRARWWLGQGAACRLHAVQHDGHRGGLGPFGPQIRPDVRQTRLCPLVRGRRNGGGWIQRGSGRFGRTGEGLRRGMLFSVVFFL